METTMNVKQQKPGFKVSKKPAPARKAPVCPDCGEKARLLPNGDHAFSCVCDDARGDYF